MFIDVVIVANEVCDCGIAVDGEWSLLLLQMKGWLLIQFRSVFGEKTVIDYRRNWDEVDLLI